MRFWLLGLAFLLLPLSIFQDFRENLVVAETNGKTITELEGIVADVQGKYNTAKKAFIKDGNKQNTKALKIAKGKLEAAQKKLDQAIEAQKIKQQAAKNAGKGVNNPEAPNKGKTEKEANINTAGNKLKSLKAEKAYVLVDINTTPTPPAGPCQICLTSEFKEITTLTGEKLKDLRDEYVGSMKMLALNETLIKRVLNQVNHKPTNNQPTRDRPSEESLGVPKQEQSDDYGEDPTGAWLSPTTKISRKFLSLLP